MKVSQKSILFFVLAIFGVGIGIASLFSPYGNLSLFNANNLIMPQNAALNWSGSLDNPYRQKVTPQYIPKLDRLVLLILEKGKNKEKPVFVGYLSNLDTGFSELLKKPQYASDAEITAIIQFLVFEVRATTVAMNSGATAAVAEITTIINTVDSTRVDEKWDYGFYVVSDKNDFDVDGEKEGCNEDGLVDPENLCVLKLGNMYISPKNFTLKGIAKQTLVSVPSLSKYGLSTVESSAYESSSSACHESLVALEESHKNSQGLIVNTDSYFAQWEVTRNSGACKTLDQEAMKYQNTTVGKNITNIAANRPTSCEALFSVTSYKADPRNTNIPTIINSTIGNKKWGQLAELGGDGISGTCSQNGSNKKGFCGLELNKSKLQMVSDGIYYGFKSSTNETSFIGSSSMNPFKDGVFLSLGDNLRAKPTPPVYGATQIRTEFIDGMDRNVGYQPITKEAEVTIGGETFVSGKDEDRLLVRCVAY